MIKNNDSVILFKRKNIFSGYCFEASKLIKIEPNNSSDEIIEAKEFSIKIKYMVKKGRFTMKKHLLHLVII